MNREISGKKALVVGAYGGMGRAVSLALAREGAATALMGRDAAALEELVQACQQTGSESRAVVCDIAETDSIGPAVAETITALDGLHFLINCAGLYKGGKGYEVELSDWDRTLDINLRAHYHLARHALPEINKAPGSAVIKIGSIASSYSGAGGFLATTRGLDGYADALFEDVREFGTKVCTIRPGFVNTPMARSDRLDPSRMIQTEDIARTVLFVLTMPATVCPTEIVLRPQRSPYRAST